MITNDTFNVIHHINLPTTWHNIAWCHNPLLALLFGVAQMFLDYWYINTLHYEEQSFLQVRTQFIYTNRMYFVALHK